MQQCKLSHYHSKSVPNYQFLNKSNERQHSHSDLFESIIIPQRVTQWLLKSSYLLHVHCMYSTLNSSPYTACTMTDFTRNLDIIVMCSTIATLLSCTQFNKSWTKYWYCKIKFGTKTVMSILRSHLDAALSTFNLHLFFGLKRQP